MYTGEVSVCAVSDCDQPAKTKGLCHAHYARWKRTGTTDGGPIKRYFPRGQQCMVAECGRSASAKGFCVAHFTRWRRYGDPLGSAPKRPPTHYSPERRAAIRAGIQRSWQTRGDRSHPPDCGHCLATRGRPKPPFTQTHRDRLSAAKRAIEPSYGSIHHVRLRRDRGSPTNFTCRCGKPAREWALVDPPAEFLRYDSIGRAFSIRTQDYRAMCVSCHRRMDAAARKQRRGAA
jgi:hypothetical protein